MKQKITTIFLLCFLFLFSGCYRYIYWAESIVDQGDRIETCVTMVQPYLRSARIYDQFTTIGLFDALWLHDTVIQAYACAHAAKYGLDNEQYSEFLQNQRDENSSYISFYLLAVIPGNVGVLLTDTNSIWALQLRIGNDYFKPAKIKIVEFEQEYRYFFGKQLTVFKKQYLIQFNARDAHSMPLINSATSEIELYFRSVSHQTSMVWNMRDIQCYAQCPPLQDDTMAYDMNVNI